MNQLELLDLKGMMSFGDDVWGMAGMAKKTPSLRRVQSVNDTARSFLFISLDSEGMQLFLDNWQTVLVFFRVSGVRGGATCRRVLP